MGAKLVGHDYNRDLWLQRGSHQYKSVIDTLAEEEGLPYTAAFTLFDADTDLWHTGSRKPLSQRGPVNQGHFVGFRRLKKLHIYNCAWSQPPSSPRRQQHLVEIKRRTFPNSWPAPVLSFNNRMNELRTAEGIKKHYARPFFFLKDPSPPQPPCPDYAVPMYQIQSEMMNSNLKSSLPLFSWHRWLFHQHTQIWSCGDLQEMS